MMQKFGLRFKLCALIAPPLLVLGVIAVQGVLLSLNGAGPDLESDVRTLGILALATFLLTGLVTITVGRALLTPLEQATAAAKELSEKRLPHMLDTLRNPGAEVQTFEPLESDEGGELGELVRALNDVQQSVADLAGEQQSIVRSGLKDLVVNMARRNQSLLDRQIEVIDRVESSEEDPARLEDLYNLDHLATRMRRNAESLLVLAGAEPSRRRGGPVEVSDIMRVAMSEIEDYRHIELQSIESAKVGPQNAVDLAHLASELMENATQFSPPDATVNIRGAQHPDGSYLISITDSGIGMDDEALEAANTILRTPPELGLGLTRSLGFIVVGRLAQRLGVRVELARGATSGITAIVEVPASTLYGYVAPAEQGGPENTVPEVTASIVAPTAAPETNSAEPDATNHRVSSELASVTMAEQTATAPAAVTELAEESWTPPAMPERGTPLTGATEQPRAATPQNEPVVAADSTQPNPLDGPPSDALAKLLGMAPGSSPEQSIDSAEPLVRETDQLFESQSTPSDPWADRVEANNDETPWVAPEFDPAASAFSDESPFSGESPFGETAPLVSEQPPERLADAIPSSDGFDSGLADLLAPEPETTTSGLIKRDRTSSQAPISAERPVAASVRSPEEIRSMLARYRDGLKGKPGPAPAPNDDARMPAPPSTPANNDTTDSPFATPSPASNPFDTNPFGDQS